MVLGVAHPGALIAANKSGAFSSGLALYRRVEPSPLPGEWWSNTCSVVDVTSYRLELLWCLLCLAKRTPSARESPWWIELLDHAIRMSKMNASEGLSERDNMNFITIAQSLGVVEFAAQDDSRHEMLIASGVVEALEYGILHDFAFGGSSIAAYAAGGAVPTPTNMYLKVLPLFVPCVSLSLYLSVAVSLCLYVTYMTI
eukprot:SAG22_NODE_8248_length_671_cov_0.900350_2_plen_198_part_01